MTFKVAVIGGGITGVLVAYNLCLSGCQTVLFDSHCLYAATANNPGGINPLHGSAFASGLENLYAQSFALHLQLDHKLGLNRDSEGSFRRIHRLFLGFTQQDLSSLESMQALYAKTPGFEATLVDQIDLRRLDPRLPEDCAQGLFTYGNVSVVSSDYCRTIHAAASEYGLLTCPDQVISLGESAGRITKVMTNHGSFGVDAVVLAAGAWSQALLDTLGIYPGLLRPVKGEMLLVDLRDSPPIGFDITHGLRGCYHHAANQYWLGGTRDDPADHPGPSESGRLSIMEGIHAILPGLNLERALVLKHCAGYRPSTCNDLPVVGPLLPFSNLIIASGGGSKGVLLSPWLAHIAVAFTTGCCPEVPSPLLPHRSFN